MKKDGEDTSNEREWKVKKIVPGVWERRKGKMNVWGN